jgi:hypothetical protein
MGFIFQVQIYGKDNLNPVHPFKRKQTKYTSFLESGFSSVQSEVIEYSFKTYKTAGH